MSMRKLVSLFCLVLLLSGCYNRGPITPDAWNLTEQQLDSISFYTTHHYTQNYNFVVTGDSLVVARCRICRDYGDRRRKTKRLYYLTSP